MNQYNKALDNGAGGPDEISDDQVKQLLSNFKRKGFDSLTLEEVATALLIPNFGKTFQQHTGMDWTGKYEIKALDRLNHAKFDIQWMKRKNQGGEHSALFMNCQRGDLVKVRQYLKDNKDLKSVVDATKKSPLHISSIYGHISIVEVLILYGYNPNSRDRTFKTPLHYAALHGHETIADTLLKAGSDIMARDSLGRTPIHFASSGPSPTVLQLLLSTKPELSNDLDQRNRGPLHYCVWNSTQYQVEELRILLDFRANPLAVDDDVKTPIHHASEGGKIRALPILLQRGGKDAMLMRDRGNKTPLELAANDRTREVLIVYTSPPMNCEQTDINFLDSAIQGTKLAKQKQQEVLGQKSPPPPIKKQFPVVEKEVIQANPAQPKQKWAPTAINQWIREKFFVLMKQVQESGIKANHHLKKPYVYTGSWMEGINTMEELYGAIRDIPAGEAMVRAFNVLCPFDRELPQAKGIEDVVDGFYGEVWFDGSAQVNRTEQIEDIRRKMQKEYLTIITDLETQIQLKAQQIFEADQEAAQAKAAVEVQKRRELTMQDKLQNQQDQSNKQIKQKEDQIKQIQNELKNKDKIIENLRSQIEELRNIPQGVPEEEVQQYEQEINQLKDDIIRIKDEEKTNRNQIGQLFKKTIQTLKQQYEEKIEQTKQDITEQMKAEREQELDKIKQEKAKLIQQQQQQNQSKKEQQEQLYQPQIDNLQDDEAIIVLLKSLKGNPPPMKQRMRHVDGDLDGKLTEDEFKQFLGKLKLQESDIYSLCRIAGFTSGKQLIGIDEFVQILQGRPKQREQFEQILFCKLIDAIKARNLTIEQTFQLLDTDGSGNLSPVELKQGLKSLKIILNQKDLNNMFCIFDADKGGSISLTEMKETLDKYEKLRVQNQGEMPDLSQNEERIKSVDEENPFSDVEINEKELQQDEGKDWVIDPQDFSNLYGKLKIQIVKGSPLEYKAIYCIALVKGSQPTDKTFVLFSKTEFQQVLFIQIENILKENLSEYLILQFYANEFGEQNFIGDVKILWKETINKPNVYLINNKFNYTNTTFIKEESKMYKPQGYIYLQIKYIPEDIPKQQQIKAETKPTFLGSIVEEGILDINLVSCVLTEDMKNLKEPKYFCQLKFMSLSETLQAKLSANRDLYWGSKFQQKLKCVTQDNIQCVFVKVYVETPKNFIMSDKQTFGEFYIDWKECLIQPGEFLSQKSFKLGQLQSKIYLKLRYIPQSMMQKFVDYQGGVSDKQKKKQLSLEDMQTGTLKVLFVRGVNLRADDGDTSDPYCLVKILSFEKEIKIKSKTIKATLNPEWKQVQEIPNLLLPKEAPYPPLDVEVFDEDRLGDDSLGTCKIDIGPSIEKPCTWAVNDYFNLNDPEAKQQPQVYIQTYWVPKGVKDPNLKAKDKSDTSGAADQDPNSIDGTLLVRVVHIRDIQGKNPDPYVLITFPNNKELKTETISSTNNPVFNQTLSYTFTIPKESSSVPLKVIVKDSNFFSDSVIGQTDVNWETCISKPGEWAINQVYTLNGQADQKQFGSVGYIYLQIKFLERGMIDDQAEAPLTENLYEILNQKQGLYQGALRIFLVHARNLVIADETTSDPYVIFKVPGGKKVESLVKKETLNPSWKTIYNIDVSMPKNNLAPLRAEVYDDDLMGDDYMGFAEVDLKNCFDNPQQWKFNEVIDIKGDQKLQSQYKTQKFGKIYLQIMFCQQGIKNNDPPLPLTEDLDIILREQEQENKKPMKGQLQINIPFAIGLKADDGTTSDPYCELQFPDKLKIKTKMIEKTVNPVFNFSYKWNCNIIKEQYTPIKIDIYDCDRLSDDLLETFYVEWIDCFNNPTYWQINRMYPLSEGKIYVQSKFLLPGQENTPEGQKECDPLEEVKSDKIQDILATNEKKQLKVEDMQKGTLKVLFVRAINLRADDGATSDPYCIAKIHSFNTEMKIRSKTIKKTLNPEWKELIPIQNLLIPKETPYPALDIQVFDEDTLGDDSLGTCKIDITPSISQPCTWGINDMFDINDPQAKQKPQLYLQTYWVPDGMKDPNLKATDKFDSAGCVDQDPNQIQGTLLVKVVHIRDLQGKNPDPYVAITFPGNKELKTETISSSNNPIYNQILKNEFTIPKQNASIPLKVIVKDKNILSDELLGTTDVNWEVCVEKPGDWAINQVYDLNAVDKNKQFGAVGYIYIQVKYLEKGMTDDKAEAPLTENLSEILNQRKGVFQGVLKVYLVHARSLVIADSKASDPYVKFNVPGGKKVESSIKKDTLNPIWKTIYNIEVSMAKDNLQPLSVEVYDDDLVNDELMGYVQIDLLECFSNPQLWKFNEVKDLQGDLKLQQKYKTQDFGKIYMQIMFCQQGIQNTDPPLPLIEDLDAILRAQEQESKKPMKGTLYINIPRARGLKADDGTTSDPYCQLYFPDKLKIKTKMIKKTVNPDFDFQYKWNCDIKKEQYAPIKVEIYDSDTFSDDLLETFYIEWMECYKNPTEWVINKNYPLNQGVIYVQCKFCYPGQENAGQKECPQIQETK